jgi:signal peptidase
MLRYANRALEAVLVFYVVGLLALALAAVIGPSAGHGLYAVRSGSMAPTLEVGDLVVARRVDPDEIQPGDIVTIAVGARAIVTHRVVAVQPNDDGPLYTTRGDANASADPLAARADQIRGRLDGRVALLGFVLAMLSMPTGVVALFSIGATMLTAAWLLDEIQADQEDELEDIRRRPDPEPTAART